MVICTTLGPDGGLGHGLGRAPRVALATVSDDQVSSWEEVDVGWDRLHDEGTEGSHHARIARFLRDHQVEVVVTPRLGAGMQRMLGTMGIDVLLGAEGDPRQVVLDAARRRGDT